MVDHISITNATSASPSRISWGSVIAGAVVASAVMFTLCELGMAIGFGLVKPQDPSQDSTLPTLAMSGVIGWTVSAIISTFVGAWAASYLARQSQAGDGVMHGLLVWGLGIVAMVGLSATAAGVLAGGAFSLVGSGMRAGGSALGGLAHGAGAAVGGAAHGAGAMMSGDRQEGPRFDWDSIKYRAESLLRRGGVAQNGANANRSSAGGQGAAQDANGAARNAQANGTQPNASTTPGTAGTATAANGATANGAVAGASEHGDVRIGYDGTRSSDDRDNGGAEPMALVGRIFGDASGGSLSDSDRSALTSMLTSDAGMSQEDATRQIQLWEREAQQARQRFQALKDQAEQKARDAAATTARTLSDAAWAAFATAVLTASAALFGGHLGSSRSARRLGGAPSSAPSGVAHPA